MKLRNDMGAAEVDLDYSALIRVATAAYLAARRTIQRELAKQEQEHDRVWQENNGCSCDIYMTAERIKDASVRLYEASNTLHALIGGLSREYKTLVNIPKDYRHVWREEK